MYWQGQHVCDALFGVLQCMVIGQDILKLILVDGREVLGQIVWKMRNFFALSDADFNP